MAMEEDAGIGYCRDRRESTLKHVLCGGNFLTRPLTGTLRRTIYIAIQPGQGATSSPAFNEAAGEVPIARIERALE
jgi:hypothetical protein